MEDVLAAARGRRLPGAGRCFFRLFNGQLFEHDWRGFFGDGQLLFNNWSGFRNLCHCSQLILNIKDRNGDRAWKLVARKDSQNALTIAFEAEQSTHDRRLAQPRENSRIRSGVRRM